MDAHQIVYSKNVVEFVTVASEYCISVENVAKISAEANLQKMEKLLPLLYLKASMLPKPERILDEWQTLTSCVERPRRGEVAVTLLSPARQARPTWIYRWTRAELPPATASTWFNVAIVVSPGKVVSNAP